MSVHLAWTDGEVRLGVGGGAAWCLLRHITTLEKEVSALQARVEAHGRMTQEVMTNMARKQAQVARNQVALLDALRALPWANSRCCSSDDGGAGRSSDESNMGDAAAAHRRGEDKVLKGPAGQKPIPQQSVGARWQKWLTRKHDNYINVLEAQAVFSILRWRTLTVRLHRRRDWDSTLGFPGEGWRVSKMARKSCYVFWLKDKILLRRIQRGLDKLVADHEDAKFERRRAAIARRQAAAWVARAERVYMRTMRAGCLRRRTPGPTDIAHIRANLALALANQLQMRRHLKEARERAAIFGIIRERGSHALRAEQASVTRCSAMWRRMGLRLEEYA